MPTTDYRPGYQGSETSWVKAVVYQRTDDPFLESDGIPIEFNGKRASDKNPALIVVNTDKAIGVPGNFNFTVKADSEISDLLNIIVDDAWVDLVFYRHDQPWHVMRGLVDEIRRSETVVNGATVQTYTISGRDFQKIWELTPVWFSPYAGADLVSESIAFEVFKGIPEIIGDPATAVQAYLKKFLEAVGQSAGVNWWPPDGMPSAIEGDFLGSVTFNVDNFLNEPARKAFNPNFMQPDGTLWALAKQHSDPVFTELYCDVLPDGDPFSGRLEAGDPLEPSDTEMTVVLRDRPFPVVDPLIGDFSDSWDRLPIHTVPRQQLQTVEIGRAGHERFNAYFVASMLHQETMGKHGLTLMAPLVDKEDIKRHGMRRFDVQSSQMPDDLDPTVMAEKQRRIVRDWYCCNPYFLSGTLGLGMGRPDIRIGNRLVIPGALSQDQNESYYVETVAHSWTFGRGTRTQVGVTRGWIGKDASYRKILQEISNRYKVPAIVDESLIGWGEMA